MGTLLADSAMGPVLQKIARNVLESNGRDGDEPTYDPSAGPTVHDMRAHLEPAIGDYVYPPPLPVEFFRHINGIPLVQAIPFDHREGLGGLRLFVDHLWWGGVAEASDGTPIHTPGEIGSASESFRNWFRIGVARSVRSMSEFLQMGYSAAGDWLRTGGDEIDVPEGLMLRDLHTYWRMNFNGNGGDRVRNILEPYIVAGYLLELYTLTYLRQGYLCPVCLSSPYEDRRGIDIKVYDSDCRLRYLVDICRGPYILREIEAGGIIELQLGGGYGGNGTGFEGPLLWDTQPQQPSTDAWVVLVADLLLYLKDPEKWPLPRNEKLDRMLRFLRLPMKPADENV